MKLKHYENPTIVLLELCVSDIITDSQQVPDEPEETTPVYGTVDGGGL